MKKIMMLLAIPVMILSINSFAVLTVAQARALGDNVGVEIGPIYVSTTNDLAGNWYNIFAQDESGGVQIAGPLPAIQDLISANNLVPGSCVTLFGTNGTYENAYQISGVSMSVNYGVSNLPTAILIDIDTLATMAPDPALKSLEGKLIVITGVDFEDSGVFSQNNNTIWKNGTNANVRIQDANDHLMGTAIPFGNEVTITGIFAVYAYDYQIHPLSVNTSYLPKPLGTISVISDATGLGIVSSPYDLGSTIQGNNDSAILRMSISIATANNISITRTSGSANFSASGLISTILKDGYDNFTINYSANGTPDIPDNATFTITADNMTNIVFYVSATTLIKPAVPNIYPLSLNFSTNDITKFVTLGNDGNTSYYFNASIISGSDWLSVSPLSGTVDEQNVSLAASVDRSSLAIGSHQGLINITPSVGNAFVVTAQVEVTEANIVAAEANGPYIVNQCSLANFSAAGSKGKGLYLKWEVGFDFSTSYSSENFDYSFTNTFTPGSYDVILYVRDTNSPPKTASDSTILTINNVAPQVNIGGPYSADTDVNINFSANVVDPGILDTHEYRWDFNNDGVFEIGWTSSSIANHSYSAGGNYLAKCEVRDNHGGIGTDTATVLINAPNVPPTSQVVFQGTSLVSTNLSGLNYTLTFDGNASYDADNKPNSSLIFDWREDVENPSKSLLTR